MCFINEETGALRGSEPSVTRLEGAPPGAAVPCCRVTIHGGWHLCLLWHRPPWSGCQPLPAAMCEVTLSEAGKVWSGCRPKR